MTIKETFSRFAKDWKKYREYVSYTSRSELRAETANTYLNWVWWILEPVLLMMIYTFIFGYIFKSSEEYFPLFVMFGIAMWRFFSMSVQSSATLIVSHRMIVSRIYIPKHMLLLVLMARCGIKSLFSFMIVVVMMVVFRVHPSLEMLLVFPAVILLILFTYGVCCFIMHIGVFIEDTSYVVGVVLTMMMYMTGIFWSVEARLPGLAGLILCRTNPVTFSINVARNGLLYGVNSFHWTFLVWIAAAIVIAILGTRLVYKNENTYAKVI
ncbi:MAG: ABC transporter permease [Bacillota bacterium]|nr:ABC transporter permease [Bacillota bacterium]